MTKKEIQTQIAFEKVVSDAAKGAPDPQLKKDFEELNTKVVGYTEGLVAKDELNISEIAPLTGFERMLKARSIRLALKEGAETSGSGVPSRMWTYKYGTIDPTNVKNPKVNNKSIWQMRVQMPRDEASKKKSYPIDDDGCVSMRAYHELLLANYSKGIQEFPGGDLYFKNRIVPIIWPSCMKFNYPRGQYEDDPNEVYNLGKCNIKMPFYVFVAGPKIRNRAVMNYVAMLWMMPLTRLNTMMMELQYSLRPMSIIVKSYLYRHSRIYRTYRQMTVKMEKAKSSIEKAQSTYTSTMESASNAAGVLEDVKGGKVSVKTAAKNQVVPYEPPSPDK